MLKKIDSSQFRVGMYVHELCSSWIDTPFWQKSFLISDEAVLDKIRRSSIREAWIDTEKGLDVLGAAVDAVPAEPRREEVSPVESQTQVVQIASMSEELGRAAAIVQNSKRAVCDMFEEARMGKAINAEKGRELVKEISGSIMRNPGALIGLVRLKSKDDYTYLHSVAVCALMVALARQLGLDKQQVRDAGLAGLVHDVGKMAVPMDILNKPGKLTDPEFIAIKKHPEAGFRILQQGEGVCEAALDVCLHHHEKMDGRGYPDGLMGEQISLFARMGAVCDVYDAITSNRPYKTGWCPAESLRKMGEWGGSHFDMKVFQAFVKSVGIYPLGTLVKLQSGRLGVVVEQSGKSLLAPAVRVFFSSRSMTYIAPELIDLAAPGERDKIITREEPEKWGLKDINRYWLGDEVKSASE